MGQIFDKDVMNLQVWFVKIGIVNTFTQLDKASSKICQIFFNVMSKPCQILVKALSNPCQSLAKALAIPWQCLVNELSTHCQIIVKALSKPCQICVKNVSFQFLSNETSNELALSDICKTWHYHMFKKQLSHICHMIKHCTSGQVTSGQGHVHLAR